MDVIESQMAAESVSVWSPLAKHAKVDHRVDCSLP